MKAPLYKRIKDTTYKYKQPEKLRRALKLFARITKLSEEDLKSMVEKYRKEYKELKETLENRITVRGSFLYFVDVKESEDLKYSGSLQSVLYNKVKQRTSDWKKAYKIIEKSLIYLMEVLILQLTIPDTMLSF